MTPTISPNHAYNHLIKYPPNMYRKGRTHGWASKEEEQGRWPMMAKLAKDVDKAGER